MLKIFHYQPISALIAAGALMSGLITSCVSDDTGDGGGNVCASSEIAYQTYAVGLTQAGEKGLFSVKLTAAEPAPPNRGDNTWTVQVLDANGSPATDATISKATPFMPDHGHGSSISAVIGAADADAQTTISSIDLMMPGVWTVTLDIESDDQSDKAVFAFCIDG